MSNDKEFKNGEQQQRDFKHWSISLRDHYIMNAPVCPDWYMEHDRSNEARFCTWPVWWADRMLAERKLRYRFSVVEEQT